jgi:hypothetical protein
MLRYVPRGFWYRLTSRGRLRPPEALDAAARLSRWWASLTGRRPRPPLGLPFFRWRDVEEEWMRRLPQLSDRDLRGLTRLNDLQVLLQQPAPNTPVVWSLRTRQPVASPYAAQSALSVAPALDNVLALGRRPSPASPAAAAAALAASPLESIAWLRSPLAPRDRRDLVLLRLDLAPWVLPRLRVVGRRAEDSIAGYLARRDPSEGQRLNLLVLAVDFGDHPPRDELTACRL